MGLFKLFTVKVEVEALLIPFTLTLMLPLLFMVSSREYVSPSRICELYLSGMTLLLEVAMELVCSNGFDFDFVFDFDV